MTLMAYIGYYFMLSEFAILQAEADVWVADPPLSSGSSSLQGASRHFTYDWTFTPGVLMEPGSLVMVILAPWSTSLGVSEWHDVPKELKPRNGPWPLVQSPL